MPNKYRKGGVKAEHTILPGIGSLLQLVASCPYVHAVTPGRISRSPMGPSRPQLVFQYFQHTGLKLIGKTSTAVQEVFVVSSQKQEAYDWLISHKVVSPPVDDKPQSRSKDAKLARSAKRKPMAPEVYELTEASEMTLQRYLERMRVKSSEKLSPLTEAQREQLRQLRKKLEEAEKQKEGNGQRKREKQGHKENQAHKKARSQAQRAERTEAKKTRDRKNRKNSPPETMEDWLEETAGLSEEHWEQLLRHFGQKND